MYRVHRDMRVQGYHYHYSGVDENGDRRVMWCRDGDGRREPWHHADELVVDTRCLQRSKRRAQQRVEYYAERDRQKVEDVKMRQIVRGVRR
jgi:hypothetical protein